MTVDVAATTDVHEALSWAAPFLEHDPVATTVLGSVMTTRSTGPAHNDDGSPTGRYWVARKSGEVVGLGMRSPIDFMFSMAAASPDVSQAFARTLADTEDELAATSGEARASAAFAGEWASLRGCSVRVTAAQQLYELVELTPPEPTPGQQLELRLAQDDDVAFLCDWFIGFDRETFDHGIDPEPVVRSKLGALRILTDKGEDCSMAGATPSANGVRRIQSVYTPAAHRGKGYAAAVTAHVSQAVIDGGDRAVLFTDLANPGANRIYRRLGYEPRGEFMNWALG